MVWGKKSKLRELKTFFPFFSSPWCKKLKEYARGGDNMSSVNIFPFFPLPCWNKPGEESKKSKNLFILYEYV